MTMDMLQINHTKWSDRLVFDVALALEGSGETLDEIKQRHCISGGDLIAFSQDPVFAKKVAAYREDIREKGLTFRLKARAQAEELLTTSWGLIHCIDVSPAVKADLIKSTVRWAGLESKPGENETTGPSGGVRININFSDSAAQMTVVNEEKNT